MIASPYKKTHFRKDLGFLFGIKLIVLSLKMDMNKFDLQIINDYLLKGLIEKASHPHFDIDIYNYSRKCQYENLWDSITINMRGTVLDRQGNVVAKGFPKFFNIEEMTSIPNEPFEVFEKMDGSLGILFFYQGEWILATKGSFQSTQAIKGFSLLQKYDYQKLHKGYTYLFEIIYKENRIVCHYDFEDLILLAIYHNSSGGEVVLNSKSVDVRMSNLVRNLGFNMVKKYHGISDYRILKQMVESNHEGFVVRFQSGLRVKIKGEDYVRLHKIISNFSAVDIWHCLMNSINLESLLNNIPDEFDVWVKKIVADLKSEFLNQEKTIKELYTSKVLGRGLERKEIAQLIEAESPVSRAVIFAMIDGKDYSKIIWKSLKPIHSQLFGPQNNEKKTCSDI